jgi:hypothetical protein
MNLPQYFKIDLLPNWKDCTSENDAGIPTYIRYTSDCPGSLQISFATYKGGKEPNPSKNDLLDMSKNFGTNNNLGNLIEEESGNCAFGQYATAIFASEEYPRVQIWHLSNGKDFILITHICPEQPDKAEIIEAKEIVLNISQL